MKSGPGEALDHYVDNWCHKTPRLRELIETVIVDCGNLALLSLFYLYLYHCVVLPPVFVFVFVFHFVHLQVETLCFIVLICLLILLARVAISSHASVANANNDMVSSSFHPATMSFHVIIVSSWLRFVILDFILLR